MSDRIDPYDLPHVILGHVDTLLALLGPLRPGMDPGGYLATHEVDGHAEDTLTDLGWALAGNAARVANDACLHLARTAGHMKPDIRGYQILNDLHYDAAHNLAMVERALGGIQGSAYAVGVTQAAHALLSRFRERCQAAEGVARDLGGDEPPATADAEEEGVPIGNTPTVEQIRQAGVTLQVAANAFCDVSARAEPDPGLLSLLRERAVAAARLLWHIESGSPDVEAPDGWYDLVGRERDVLNILPTVILALESPTSDVGLPNFDARRCPAFLARDVGRTLIAWAEEEVDHV